VHPIARQSSSGLTSPSSTVQTLIAFINSIRNGFHLGQQSNNASHSSASIYLRII
jgi:hypothetical protein